MAFRQTMVRLSKSKSSAWVSRQLRDPYVKKRLTDPAAYRARSAFKLLEINDTSYQFLEQPDVHSVVDLGAAPGGWSQVVAEKFGWNSELPGGLHLSRGMEAEAGSQVEYDGAGGGMEEEDLSFREMKYRRWKQKQHKLKKEPLEYFDPLNIDDVDLDTAAIGGRGTIIAVDLLQIEHIHGVHTIKGDFLLDSTVKRIQDLLVSPRNPFGKADVILSDMAANVSGNDAHDIQCSLEICEAVLDFAQYNLRTAESIGRRHGGVLLIKFFSHPLLDQFRSDKLEPNFNYVQYIKPDSSRATSREGYFLCQGWNPV